MTATTIAVYRNKTGIVEHVVGGGEFQVQGPFTLRDYSKFQVSKVSNSTSHLKSHLEVSNKQTRLETKCAFEI